MPEEKYAGLSECRDGAYMPVDRPQINRSQMEAGCSEGPPPKSKRPRPIQIEAKDHGFIVTVGCQSFAIEKVSTLIRNLEKYLEKPDATESKWLKGELDL